MFKFDEWFFPDGETQLPEWMARINHRVDGRLTWQFHKYEAALSLCPQRRVAIDVGAHVGLFSYWMAKDFSELHAFEPCEAHRDCWQMNVTADKARLHDVALGAVHGHVTLVSTPGESGGTHVELTETGQVQRTLDSFGFANVDFLKIDCEGYEPAVIEGGMQTIIRCRPVVLVEQYGHGGQWRYGYVPTAAVDLLTAIGMRIRTVLGSDFLLEFPEV